MGATGFTTYNSGHSAARAYSDAVAQARGEYGNDGYNGTISTTSGFRQVVHSPMTLEGAHIYARLNIGGARKWEDALAIPITDDKHFTFTTVKYGFSTPAVEPVLDWDGTPTGKERSLTGHDVVDKATLAAGRKFGTSLHTISVDVKLKSKIVTENTPGNTVLRYSIGGSRELYETKVTAIRAAREALRTSDYQSELKIHACRYFPVTDSTVAVTVRKTTVSADAKVTAVKATLKDPRPAPIDGWLFFGWAAC